ncbi:MAG: glutathione synthase [Thermoanaerobaculia bacterium]|nr:glutathione synthase [Thermoanaerobaculia bacterium]
MQHLFVADPPELFLPEADTTIAFLREAGRRGHESHICQIGSLGARDGGRPFAHCTPIVTNDSEEWYELGEPESRFLDEFDVVWMRKDPPFDMRFYYATHLLSLVQPPTLVVNDPLALRDANEKLVALRFPDLCPETLISSEIKELVAFLDHLGGDMIIKPLGGAGGEGIFHLTAGDRNVRAILEMATHQETEFLMAQAYVPEVRQGDKRVIVVDGEALGAVLRVPHESESRANFHVGGSAHATELNERDLEICAQVGPTLKAMGIVFAGLDIIGHWMTEVNVTSPTGIREIAALGGPALEVDVLDAVERRWSDRRGSYRDRLGIG